jgi:hypothetical protein
MVHRMKSEGLKSQWFGGMMVHRTRSNCVLPKRGGGIAGSLNEARWVYAPTGLKGIAQGKVKRRPGIRYATISASPVRAKEWSIPYIAFIKLYFVFF